MSAYETLERILKNGKLVDCGLKFCFVDKNKIPYKQNGERARPNNIFDFVDFCDLDVSKVFDYDGIGISIQASNIFAIDVDHCFAVPFSKESADDRAKNIINLFANVAYIEFSFSGTGLRILFRKDSLIEDYTTNYYIKNSKNQIEFYQPADSFRYVTVTGNCIINNNINICPDSILFDFLDIYMSRPKKSKIDQNSIIFTENRTIEELLKLVETQYRTNIYFQNIWFGQAPGHNSDESEKDFYLISYMYEHVTKDKESLKKLFEASPYFKSKDSDHKFKWYYRDYRYLNYMYSNLKGD